MIMRVTRYRMGLYAVVVVCSTKLLTFCSSKLPRLSAALSQGMAMPLCVAEH